MKVVSYDSYIFPMRIIVGGDTENDTVAEAMKSCIEYIKDMDGDEPDEDYYENISNAKKKENYIVEDLTMEILIETVLSFEERFRGLYDETLLFSWED